MSLDPEAIRSAIREIEADFAGLTPPGDDGLLHPQCMDDGDLADFFGAPRSDDLSDGIIIRNYATPSFFSAGAFQYYMPAFMVWSLGHHDTIEFAPESTLQAFDPAAMGEEFREFQTSKFALFTPAERRAVVRFLKIFSRHPDLGALADAALSGYWADDPGGA